MKLNEFRTPEYSAPTCKVVTMNATTIICGSQDSPLYGDSNKPGSGMEDDPDYSYDL